MSQRRLPLSPIDRGVKMDGECAPLEYTDDVAARAAAPKREAYEKRRAAFEAERARQALQPVRKTLQQNQRPNRHERRKAAIDVRRAKRQKAEATK